MLCLNYCIVIFTICIFSFYTTSAEIINAQLNSYTNTRDLPLEKDFYKYLSVVENVVDFCTEYKDEININLAFGLFMTNVNLGRALQERGSKIPENVKNKIENIVNGNSMLLNGFEQSAIKDTSVSLESYHTVLDILEIFKNASYWIERLEKFVYTEEKPRFANELKEIYSPFNLYLKKVDSLNDWVPNPDSSDTCLVSLSKNPASRKDSSPHCLIEDFCYDMLKGGTNFGYSLTHRIVLIIMARFGRGCTILSQQEDKQLLQKFCSMAHAEAEYIALNDFGLADLLMEIISLCTIDGHSQFLQRTWLNNMLDFQTSDGCFGPTAVKKPKISSRSFFKGKKNKFNHILQAGCSGHTTGLASASFSAAIRYIIEEYY